MKHPLRILHIFRAPVAGLFRHVCDLARAQAQAGYEVGIICDADTGGSEGAAALAKLEPYCALGINRTPMSRQIGLRDFAAGRRVREWAKQLDADILHGHGAKGGAYARFAKRHVEAKAFYTPHGGSLNFNKTNPIGLFYHGLEKILMGATDGLIFESAFAKSTWQTKIGAITCPNKVVHNGLLEGDFVPVTHQQASYDFVFVGELRDIKGVDVLLHALAALKTDHKFRALIVGDGPERTKLTSLCQTLQLNDMVDFAGAMPARLAFAKARHLVVPSFKESLPYIVLEAAAAAQPLTATNVGGISEIFGPFSEHLIAPQDVGVLRNALQTALDEGPTGRRRAKALRKHVQAHFTVERMSADVIAFYLEQMAKSHARVRSRITTTSPAQ